MVLWFATAIIVDYVGRMRSLDGAGSNEIDGDTVASDETSLSSEDVEKQPEEEQNADDSVAKERIRDMCVYL